MTRYRVRHNFRRFQPQHWIGRYVTLYGPNNEGAAVESETAESAVQAFAESHGINPFYLEAIPDRGSPDGFGPQWRARVIHEAATEAKEKVRSNGTARFGPRGMGPDDRA